jgi:hypothetical protein
MGMIDFAPQFRPTVGYDQLLDRSVAANDVASPFSMSEGHLGKAERHVDFRCPDERAGLWTAVDAGMPGNLRGRDAGTRTKNPASRPKAWCRWRRPCCLQFRRTRTSPRFPAPGFPVNFALPDGGQPCACPTGGIGTTGSTRTIRNP